MKPTQDPSDAPQAQPARHQRPGRRGQAALGASPGAATALKPRKPRPPAAAATDEEVAEYRRQCRSYVEALVAHYRQRAQDLPRRFVHTPLARARNARIDVVLSRSTVVGSDIKVLDLLEKAVTVQLLPTHALLVLIVMGETAAAIYGHSFDPAIAIAIAAPIMWAISHFSRDQAGNAIGNRTEITLLFVGAVLVITDARLALAGLTITGAVLFFIVTPVLSKHMPGWLNSGLVGIIALIACIVAANLSRLPQDSEAVHAIALLLLLAAHYGYELLSWNVNIAFRAEGQHFRIHGLFSRQTPNVGYEGTTLSSVNENLLQRKLGVGTITFGTMLQEDENVRSISNVRKPHDARMRFDRNTSWRRRATWLANPAAMPGRPGAPSTPTSQTTPPRRKDLR